MSADFVVQSPDNLQSYNRYGYCWNNPATCTDPSGQLFVLDDIIVGALIGALISGAQSNWDVGAMAKAALLGALGGGVYSAAGGGLVGSLASGATVGGLSAGLSGGSIAEGIAWGALGGGLTYGGGYFGTIFDEVGQFIGTGIGSGLANKLAGGSFADGFKLASFSQIIAMGYDMAIKGRESFSKIPDDPLEFDGKKLVATDEKGQVVGEWPADSGRGHRCMNNPACQAKFGEGPIPENNYQIDPSKTQKWNELSFTQKIYALAGRGSWPGGPYAWGYARVPIDIPSGVTLPAGRTGNFYIHGGFERGSAGCIDLTNHNDSFFNYLSQQSELIPLTVKYSK